MRSWGSLTFQITQNSGPPLLPICTFSKKLGARWPVHPHNQDWRGRQSDSRPRSSWFWYHQLWTAPGSAGLGKNLYFFNKDICLLACSTLSLYIHLFKTTGFLLMLCFLWHNICMACSLLFCQFCSIPYDTYTYVHHSIAKNGHMLATGQRFALQVVIGSQSGRKVVTKRSQSGHQL